MTETANSGEVNFVTDIETTAATEHDSESIDDIHHRLVEHDMAPQAHYVDQGYVSGANIAHSAQRGVELKGPVGQDTSPKPAGFKQADFALDFDRQVATCPNGRTSVAWLPRPQADGRVGAHVLFRQQCDGCPYRTLCAPGKSGRSLEISPYHSEVVTRRQEEQTQCFKEDMKHRPAIEGTLSEMVRRHGLRRARYRGTRKVRLQHLCTGAAVNLKRLCCALAAQRSSQRDMATGC